MAAACPRPSAPPEAAPTPTVVTPLLRNAQATQILHGRTTSNPTTHSYSAAERRATNCGPQHDADYGSPGGCFPTGFSGSFPVVRPILGCVRASRPYRAGRARPSSSLSCYFLSGLVAVAPIVQPRP